jgi:glycosyltransferase involved in cell wall biosynthesis
MNKSVEISVVVPIYNVDPYLYQCVNSLIIQSFNNIEIILVNDGSTDCSLHICEYFRKFDNRIVLINKNKNEGLVSARKTGIKQASGKYVMFVDADDWIVKDYLEQVYNVAKKNNVDAVFSSHVRVFLGTEKIVRNKIKSGLYDKSKIQESILPKMISYGKFFSHGISSYSWGKLFLRSVLLEFQLRIPNDIIMGEDAALIFPIVVELNSLHISDIAGYYYRQRPGSIVKLVNDYKIEANKLSILFQFLKKSLSGQPSAYRFDEQLSNYVYALSLMRIGSQSTKENNLMAELELYQNSQKKLRLCLYSSGSFGQNIYKNLSKSKCYQVVNWVDEDFKESQMCGLDVSSVDEILHVDFDYVFIAALDPVIVQDAIKKLVILNVPIEQISTVHFDNELIEQSIASMGFCSDSYSFIG